MIARFPTERRDTSKLMVVNRKTGEIFHYIFRDIGNLLGSDDFIVLNNSKVIPVKLFGRIEEKDVEILIVKKLSSWVFEALTLPAKRFKLDSTISFGGDLRAKVLDVGAKGRRVLSFNRSFKDILNSGYAPLPPYIKRKSEEAFEFKDFDLKRYQTVYSKNPGSIAAPTAGLHFTEELLDRMRTNVDVVELTLNVGEATFQKIEVHDITAHKMGTENIYIGKEEIERINRLKKKKDLIAVGTTTVRALETYFIKKPMNEHFSSDLFIYPGFEFKMVDKLITNFHLPESSLFILVSAFAGLDLMKKAYSIAVENNYRFFSYGDAMYIM